MAVSIFISLFQLWCIMLRAIVSLIQHSEILKPRYSSVLTVGGSFLYTLKKSIHPLEFLIQVSHNITLLCRQRFWYIHLFCLSHTAYNDMNLTNHILV